MSAYTISRLAQDAEVSVHMARDHWTRGLVRPAAHTAAGHGVSNEQALQRLQFIRAALEAVSAFTKSLGCAER